MQEMQEMMQFIDNSLTSYHAVCEVEKQLKNNGFKCLSEKNVWNLEAGKAYYLIRNDSSLMAFRVPKCEISEIDSFFSSSSNAACVLESIPSASSIVFSFS